MLGMSQDFKNNIMKIKTLKANWRQVGCMQDGMPKEIEVIED